MFNATAMGKKKNFYGCKTLGYLIHVACIYLAQHNKKTSSPLHGKTVISFSRTLPHCSYTRMASGTCKILHCVDLTTKLLRSQSYSALNPDHRGNL